MFREAFNVLIVLAVCSTVFSYNPVHELSEDFNKDGFKDSLFVFDDGGSGGGGRFAELTDGRTKEVFKMDTWGTFSEIKQIVKIPEKLLKKGNESFLEAIKVRLFYFPLKEYADPSLEWIINSNQNFVRIDNDPDVDLIIKNDIKWYKGKIQLPDVYCLELPYKNYDPLKKKGFLIYYANNHFNQFMKDSLLLADSSPIYKVYKTSHGVIAEKGNEYAWIFVTDHDMTGGPEKLRFSSITGVEIIGNYAVIKFNSSSDPSLLVKNFKERCPTYDRVFIVDMETGIVARLKTTMWERILFVYNGKIIKDDLKPKIHELLSKYFKD